MMMRKNFLLMPIFLLALGCDGDGTKGDDTEVDADGLDGEDSEDDHPDDDSDDSDDDDDDDEDGDDDEEDEDGEIATITVSGTVEVELYTMNGSNREAVDPSVLEEIEALDFPFGAIFVGGYQDPEDTGSEDYKGTDTISLPEWGENPFEMTVVEADMADGLHVYAALDYNQNTIIESSDPTGIWPTEIQVIEGKDVDDVKIVILAEYHESGPGGGGSGGGGDCGTDDGTRPIISGPVTVGKQYEGDGVAMLLNADGTGPVHWTEFTVTPDEDGAAGTSSYAMTVCPELGTMQLTGIIDDNSNGLYDPADTNGAYVTAPDTNGNPINVASADLVDYELQIPIINPDTGEEEDNRIELVPYVRISGDITYGSGTFDDLDPGTKVYVAALKYRSDTSVTLASVTANAYDIQEFDWNDVTGEASLPYELLVPGNTELYLWAYADLDLDGTLNEVNEPVASANSSRSGRVTTGMSNLVLDLLLDEI